jgi:cytochrome c biogenesis protein CcmG, thiol:disulfide interchange protein DsbE
MNYSGKGLKPLVGGVDMTDSIPRLEPHRTKKFSPITIVLTLGVLIIIAVIGIQLVQRNATQPDSGSAPDFTIPLYRNGGDFNLSDQRGKIVVVNFWGSWCPPCRKEAPFLEAVHQRYGEQGVVVVGVNFRDTEDAALEFLDEYNITYLNGFDVGEQVTASYNVARAPETFVIDQDGNIQKYLFGEVDATRLVPVLEELLGQET